MKTLSSAALLAALAVSPLIAHAAVDPAIISADARWVVYADLNTLRSTALGKELIAMAEQAQLQNAKIGLNVPKVLETVGTVTAYGSNFTPKPEAMDGTLILQGTPDLRKIAESVLLQATIAYPDVVAESKELPFPSYTITPKPKGQTPQLAVIVAFPPEPIVLVSKSRAQLLKAREVYRGSGGSIARTADAPLRPLLRGATGAYLFAASVVPADTVFPEDQPQARILKMTNSGSVAVGEQGPNTFAHARLIATSDDMADKLMKILQGMTAMMSLAQTNDKDLSQFLSSATVTRDDRTVALNLSYSTQRLAEILHSLAERPRESREELAERQRERLLNGEPLAEWHAEPAKAEGDHDGAVALAWRTIENVELKNGARISLGQDSRGGKPVHFDRVEIIPADGGAPMVFKRDFMRSGGPRGNLQTFAFPGVDGRYTLKIAYQNDPAGKALYAVSIRQPKATEPAADEHTPAAADASKS